MTAVLDLDPADDDEDLPELSEPVGRELVRTAAHRQSLPASQRGPSWWVSAPPEGFTKVGQTETAKTAHTRAASGIWSRFIEE